MRGYFEWGGLELAERRIGGSCDCYYCKYALLSIMGVAKFHLLFSFAKNSDVEQKFQLLHLENNFNGGEGERKCE